MTSVLDRPLTASSRPAPAQRQLLSDKLPNLLAGAAGIVVVLAIWWLLSATALHSGGAVPTPLSVVRSIVDDGWSFYGPNLGRTSTEAMWGFLWGNLAAIAIAAAVLLIPLLEGVATQLALVTYCMPIVAVGPILTIAFTGHTPMEALAALSVFFTTLVGTLLSLRAADPVTLDLISAYGGGRWQQLYRVRMVAAVPGVLNALKLAAPAAVLGAIIGEFLGHADAGLGTAMITAEQQLNVSRTWAVAVVASCAAGAGYAVFAVISAIVSPRITGRGGEAPGTAAPAARANARLARMASTLLLTLVVIGVLWVGFLKVCHLDPLVGKSPVDVWKYLLDSPDAGSNLSDLMSAAGTTLTDAAYGFVAGLGAAILIALAFVLSSPLERTLMPVAMIVRSVPLVAMTPVIVLVFGRGVGAVTVIGGVVVFFPALVNMAFGLRSAPVAMTELVHAYGGGRFAVLRSVALPSALPAFFASARISVPGAMVGALVAEWLATGRGLGYRMLSDVSGFAYADLWSGVVVLTVLCTAAYAVVGALENMVLRRTGMLGS